MRGYRAFLLVTAHLLVLSTLIGLIYLVFSTSNPSFSSLQDRQLFSKLIFSVLVIFELVMVTFITPALSAGSFTMEKERHTYDLLRVTSLSSPALVFGKVASVLSFIFLLLLTSIPILSPSFIIGGVLDMEIFLSYATLVASAFAFSSIGILFSSLINRTLVAIVLTYACAVFLMFGIPIMLVTALVIVQTGNLARVEDLSPAIYSAWLMIGLTAISMSPLATLIATEYFIIEQNNFWMVEIVLNENATYIMVSPWISHLMFYGLLTVIFLWITIQRVKIVES